MVWSFYFSKQRDTVQWSMLWRLRRTANWLVAYTTDCILKNNFLKKVSFEFLLPSFVSIFAKFVKNFPEFNVSQYEFHQSGK